MKSSTTISPKLNGQITIKKYITKDGELVLKDEVSQNNIINKRAIERLFMDNTTVFDDSRRIAISSDIYTPDYERTNVSNVIAIGDPNLSGVTGWTFEEETQTTPRAITYHNRFLTPSSQRDFNTIALVDGTTNNNTSNITSNAYAYATFGTTVTQEINEIIDIYYKVYMSWNNANQDLNPSFQDEIEYLFLGQTTSGLLYDDNNESVEIHSPNNPDYNLRWRATEGKSNTVTYTERRDYLKREYTGTADFSDNRIHFGISYGRLERNGSGLDRFQGTAGIMPIKLNSSIGNVFSHAETADTYFYDINGLAGSSWQPTITDTSNYTDILPSLYTLKVESSGGLGIGTYSIYRTIFSGEYSTGLTADISPLPLIVTSKYPFFDSPDSETGFPYNPQWIYKWDGETYWVSANETEVGIWSIYPEFQLVSSWALATTKIRDIATDPSNQYIYVATVDGLFSINVVSDTVTQLSTDSCMAVDVSFSGAVFAVFTDRLASSLNASWADSHSFTGTIDFSKVMFIRCDRDSTDYNLAILELSFLDPDDLAGDRSNRNNQDFAKIHWWNNVTGYGVTSCTVRSGNTINFSARILYPFNSSFICENSTWIYPKYITSNNLSFNNMRGFSRHFSKHLTARGSTVVNTDGSLGNISTQSIAGSFQLGAANFNQELGDITYNKPHYDNQPSFAYLGQDASTIRLCIGGYQGFTGTSTSYNSSRFTSTGGAFNFDIATNDLQPYRGEEVNTYYFTPYSNSSGSSRLYYLGGNIQKVSGGILSFCDSSASTSDYAFAGGNKHTGTHFHPLMIGYWGAYNPNGLFNYGAEGNSSAGRDWSIRYGWNDIASQWELDPLGLLPGKPLHTALEPAPEGLSIAWADLQPGDSRDLIANQWYSFTKVPGELGFVQDGSYGSVNFKFSYYLRPTVDYNLNTTITASLTLDPATTDPLWLSLDPFEEDVITLNIAGYVDPATVLLSGSPGVNEVAIADAQLGTLTFNAADVGKAVTGNILYMQKVHSTEVL